MLTRPLFENIDEMEFTNRETELKFLRQLTKRAIKNKGPSYTIIARKGMGKTALLLRFYNELFCQQREVVPFYVDLGQFKGADPTSLTIRDFMHYYLRTLATQYIAFHLADRLTVRRRSDYHTLLTIVENHSDDIPAADDLRYYITLGLDITVENYRSYLPEVIQFTRQFLGDNNFAPGILLIDEFQVLTDLHDEKAGLRDNITEIFQKTAESRWCPMVVTGSAVSLITKTTMGGLLARRFSAYHLMPFNDKHTLEYGTKLAEQNDIFLHEGLAYQLHKLTGGNPHYIWCLLDSNSLINGNKTIATQKALQTLYEYELNDPNGKLRTFWDIHFDLMADLLNGEGDSLRILYYLATQEKNDVNIHEVAAYLERDPVETNRLLNNLYQADLVERTLGRLYQGIKDPVLADYIIQRYKTTLEQGNAADYLTEFREEFNRKMGSMSRAVGHAAELFAMGLLDRFKGQAVDAQTCLGQVEIINLPHFSSINNRSGVIIEGDHIEFDIVAESEDERWLIEVRHRQKPQGLSAVEKFLTKIEQLQDGKEYQAWFLSFSGFTEPAKERLQELGHYFSDRAGFNLLADIVGYIHFPDQEPMQKRSGS